MVREAFWDALGASYVPLGWLLGSLAACWEALGASWQPLGASWGLLAASWEPLGAVFGRSWRLLSGLWLVLGWSWGLLGGKVALAAAGARFWELPGGLLGGKVALARAGGGFSGLPKIHDTVWARCKRSKLGGVRPPQKLLAKAKSDTIMSLLAN